jgi:predicted outer membrane protein
MVRKMEVAAFLALAIAGPAFAQEREPARPQVQPGAATQITQQQLDAHLANCLVLGNQEEIALCRYALERIDDEKVKELAQKMIDDHEKFVTQLRRYASKDKSFELRTGSKGKETIRRVGGTDEDRPDKTTRPATGAPGATTAARPAGDVAARMFAIAQETAEECLKLTQECLSQYEGKEFDQAFLGQQVGAHIGMQAKMKVAEGHVSPEFKELLRTGQKTAKEHKQHAEKLMGKVASSK